MPHDLPDYSIAPSFAVVLPTIYGDMIFHRGDVSQTQAHLKLGRSADHREIELLARVLSYLPPDRCVVDVGANFGSFSLALSKVVGESGTVHAFEAQRVIFNMLAGTMALNSATNVFCHNMAVGDRMGRIEVPQFDYRGEPMSYGSVEFGPTQRQKLEQQRGNSPVRQEYVAATTIDWFEFPRVDLLKIDVEGMEMAGLWTVPCARSCVAAP